MTDAGQFVRTFVEGFLPQLPRAAVCALRKALREGDARLLHGATVRPCAFPLRNYGLPAEGGCLVGFGRIAAGPATAGDVDGYFLAACAAARRLLGRSGYARVSGMLEFWDARPAEARAALLAELEALPRW